MYKHLCPLSIVVSVLAGSALAADLAPYQQDALEKILATMDAETRAFAKPELEAMLAGMGEAEVQFVLQGMLGATPDNPPEDLPEEGPVDVSASADDLEYNRRQYEPALREAWQASKAFDEFVDLTLAANCPSGDEVAVWGSGWRFELAPLQPYWARASDSADTDVLVLGSSYAPQDGRYRFDFSAVRNEFDRAAVKDAIVSACKAYREVGAAFVAEARANISDENLAHGMNLQKPYDTRVLSILDALGNRLQALAPTGNMAIINAMLSATRVE